MIQSDLIVGTKVAEGLGAPSTGGVSAGEAASIVLNCVRTGWKEPGRSRWFTTAGEDTCRWREEELACRQLCDKLDEYK
jgi:hypothetical protein